MQRAQLAAQIEAFEDWLFSRHLEPAAVASPKRAPAASPPDTEPVRARIATELGVPDLEQRLALYGDPPRAPAGPAVADVRTLEREIRRALVKEVSVWSIAQRRDLRAEARSRAADEYAAKLKAQDEKRAALQVRLDKEAAELASAREQVEALCDEWVRHEVERLERSRIDQQIVYDDEWRRLQRNDPPTVVSALREAFAGEAVTPLGAEDATALIVVACPGPDEIIADQEPAVTGAGRPTVRKRSKTQINELYAAAIGSRILGAVDRALSAAPALDALAVVAIRESESSERGWDAVYIAIFEREVLDELKASCWSDDPNDILDAIDLPEEASYDTGGRTGEVRPLPLEDDPELRAVLERMDARTSEDEESVSRADQLAAAVFLRLSLNPPMGL